MISTTRCAKTWHTVEYGGCRLSYLLSAVVLKRKGINYPSLRYLWEQIRNAFFHTFLFLSHAPAFHPQAYRTRFPELDEKAVEVQPLPIVCFSKEFPGIRTEEGQEVRHINWDLSEVSMVGCDGLKCHGDPSAL